MIVQISRHARQQARKRLGLNSKAIYRSFKRALNVDNYIFKGREEKLIINDNFKYIFIMFNSTKGATCRLITVYKEDNQDRDTWINRNKYYQGVLMKKRNKLSRIKD